ncbi:DUF3619 family protein [Tibeticola sp.]|jgi:hypothetical protein|uniref:DUF3619 family protein n=1 Tax=Tibeticola sp. TaxID=2005368 RepID=UPI002584D73E|nr:DUF3619 family protein [Tibeticola sp.]MCI4441036.1 DUF3619 family protein [Tibeticola sp.]
MNTRAHSTTPSPEDRFGRSVAAVLSLGTAELPHEVSERLRAARERAVAVRRREAVLRPQTASAVEIQSDMTASLGSGGESEAWWRRAWALLPLLALLWGLYLLEHAFNDERAQEAAAIDAALLTDDLPPQAYTDPGFIQFLKVAPTEGAGR